MYPCIYMFKLGIYGKSRHFKFQRLHDQHNIIFIYLTNANRGNITKFGEILYNIVTRTKYIILYSQGRI